jgi:glutamyl-tRNA synthetase
LLKSDGFPTYHLANIVDDHLMGVTDVIRGEEWLSSTPKHVIMYEMLNWEMPNFAHLPLILNEDKSKLSKRQGDVAVEDYLAKGYLPEALINFVALLGFNPRDDQEIYSMDELIDEFDLSKVNKGGAVFDREKLEWMNGQYIRQKDLDELVALVKPFIKEAGKEIEDAFLKKICKVEQERLELLGDVVDLLDGYQNKPEYEPSLLVWRKSDAEGARKNLQNLVEYIQGEMTEDDFAEIDTIETSIFDYIKSNDLGNGDVLWPMRAALSGRSASPSPFELAWVFGKVETIERLNHAIDTLEE